MIADVAERRAEPDRRVRRVSLRYPERRSGFERRQPDGGPVRVGYLRMLRRYGAQPRAVGAVCWVIVVANAADLVLTLRALDGGAVELNPVMAGLIAASPVAAAVFKLAVAVLVAGGIWALRRYRRSLELSLVLLAVMTALLGYHAVVLTTTG